MSPLEKAFRTNAALYLARAELNEKVGLAEASDECLRLASDCEAAANALRDMSAKVPTYRNFQPS